MGSAAGSASADSGSASSDSGSSVVSSSVLSSAICLARLSPLTLVLHSQDAGDLALRVPQAGAVLEHTGRGLGAKVEKLVARLGHPPVELVVAELAQLPSS